MTAKATIIIVILVFLMAISLRLIEFPKQERYQRQYCYGNLYYPICVD